MKIYFIFITFIFITNHQVSGNSELKSALKQLRTQIPSLQRHQLHKRNACDNGKGNYGINSFNFLSFILLTFNVVANVNNNLNSNNNNKNDNNINAISQNANNVATNTNVGNAIGVTVLPIPGKRSLEFLRDRNSRGKCKVQDKTASMLFHRLVQLKEILDKDSNECQGHDICQIITETMTSLHFEDTVVMGLSQASKVPFLSLTNCRQLFLNCMF